MKALALFAAIALSANATEIRTVTTAEKQTPVTCEEIKGNLVCTMTKITATTVTITKPLPPPEPVDEAIIVDGYKV